MTITASRGTSIPVVLGQLALTRTQLQHELNRLIQETTEDPHRGMIDPDDARNLLCVAHPTYPAVMVLDMLNRIVTGHPDPDGHPFDIHTGDQPIRTGGATLTLPSPDGHMIAVPVDPCDVLPSATTWEAWVDLAERIITILNRHLPTT